MTQLTGVAQYHETFSVIPPILKDNFKKVLLHRKKMFVKLITVHCDARIPATKMTALKGMCHAYFHLFSIMQLTMSAQETTTSSGVCGAPPKLMKKACTFARAMMKIGDIAVQVLTQ
jgi:hypothetical protein